MKFPRRSGRRRYLTSFGSSWPHPCDNGMPQAVLGRAIRRPHFCPRDVVAADGVQWLPKPGNECGRSPSARPSCGRQDQGDCPYAVAASARTIRPPRLSLVARCLVPQRGPSLPAGLRDVKASRRSEGISPVVTARGRASTRVVGTACGRVTCAGMPKRAAKSCSARQRPTSDSGSGVIRRSHTSGA